VLVGVGVMALLLVGVVVGALRRSSRQRRHVRFFRRTIIGCDCIRILTFFDLHV
jgi:hypothetical protein